MYFNSSIRLTSLCRIPLERDKWSYTSIAGMGKQDYKFATQVIELVNMKKVHGHCSCFP